MLKKIKINIELTEKQLDYLGTVLFEFGDLFTKARSEYLYKALDKKIQKAKTTVESEKKFFLEKAYHKSAMKVKNSER